LLLPWKTVEIAKTVDDFAEDDVFTVGDLVFYDDAEGCFVGKVHRTPTAPRVLTVCCNTGAL
jgi:hypothetical protein